VKNAVKIIDLQQLSIFDEERYLYTESRVNVTYSN
jgi:hypothetical protein